MSQECEKNSVWTRFQFRAWNEKIAVTNYNSYSRAGSFSALARAARRAFSRRAADSDFDVKIMGKARGPGAERLMAWDLSVDGFFFTFSTCLTSAAFRLLVNLSLVARSTLGFDVLPTAVLVSFSTMRFRRLSSSRRLSRLRCLLSTMGTQTVVNHA